ncbi:hypothetical protein HDU93_008004 [Gonapodya sp. JEL0774]|nr:hypothetical protein HDU93_008004 [Gonapodya sp. JEL0774]
MSAQISSTTEPRVVHAGLRFIDLATVPKGEKPTTYSRQYNRGPNYERVEHVTPLIDLRSVDDSVFTLDVNGFQVVREPTALKPDEFYDEERVRNIYHPEVERIIKKYTGATRTLVFDTVIRSPHTNIGPGDAIHSDYTRKSGYARARDHLSPEDADRLTKGRFAVINLWRPIRTVVSWPLALADATSTPYADLIPQNLVYPHRVGETGIFAHKPGRRFYFLSQQKSDEAYLLKTFESSTGKAGRFAPHGAFRDPSAGEDAPPRESLEVRVLVFWESEATKL